MRSQGGSLVKEVGSVAHTHQLSKDRVFLHDYSDLRHQQRQGQWNNYLKSDERNTEKKTNTPTIVMDNVSVSVDTVSGLWWDGF